MTRFTKSSTGKYVVSGKSYETLIGTRAQVWHGTSYKTSGGLTKGDILQNKNGRIVSRSKHSSAKKENRLVKAGYGTKKGKFGFVKLNGKSHKRSKKMRGGFGSNSNSSSNSNNSNSNSNNSNSNSSSSQPSASQVAMLKQMNSNSNNSGSNSNSNNSNSNSNSKISMKGGVGNSSSGSSSSSNNMAKMVMAQNQGNTNSSNSNSSLSSMKKGGRRRRKGKRGGSVNFALSPSHYDGKGVTTSGNAVQFAAGMGN
jgi:hypothetical protein